VIRSKEMYPAADEQARRQIRPQLRALPEGFPDSGDVLVQESFCLRVDKVSSYGRWLDSARNIERISASRRRLRQSSPPHIRINRSENVTPCPYVRSYTGDVDLWSAQSERVNPARIPTGNMDDLCQFIATCDSVPLSAAKATVPSIKSPWGFAARIGMAMEQARTKPHTPRELSPDRTRAPRG